MASSRESSEPITQEPPAATASAPLAFRSLESTSTSRSPPTLPSTVREPTTATTMPPATASTTTTSAASARCAIGIAVEPRLQPAVAAAIDSLQEYFDEVELTLANDGSAVIRYGGEWPVDEPPALAWTDVDVALILINPEHPYSTVETVLTEVVVHELAHLLINEPHTDDLTLLDPQLDGQIIVGHHDRSALNAIDCKHPLAR